MDLEVACAHHFRVFEVALLNHILFSIVFKLSFHFFNDAHEKAFATFIGFNILSTEYLKDLSSEESPLGCIVRIAEVLKHLLEELVSDLVGSNLLDVIFNDDLVLNQAKTLVLEYIKEQVVLHLSQLLLDPLDSVAWMEQVKLLHSFLSRLSRDQAVVVNMLLEASSDVRLRLDLDSCVDTHVLDDLQWLLRIILHELFRHLGGSFILRLVWSVDLLVILDILHELDGVEHAFAGETVETSLPSTQNELLFLHWQLLAGVGHDAG